MEGGRQTYNWISKIFISVAAIKMVIDVVLIQVTNYKLCNRGTFVIDLPLCQTMHIIDLTSWSLS